MKTILSSAAAKLALVFTSVLAGALAPQVTAAAPAPAVAAAPADAATAMETAAKENKFVILSLHRGEEGRSAPILAAAERLAKETKGKATAVTADIKSESLAAFFNLTNIDAETFPVPALVVVSPNTIITGVFRQEPTLDVLLTKFPPPQALDILGKLAEGHRVWVLVQGKNTTGNVETEQALTAFAAAANKESNMIVKKVDYDLPENADFLKQIKVDPGQKECTTLFMTPPGRIQGQPIYGIPTKAQMQETSKPQKSCCPGGDC